jgi:hypothetical protein
MSGAATTFTTARFLTADYLVRGQDNPLSCPLWSAGALVAPTESESTVSIYDAGGTAIVTAADVTVTSSIATFTLPAALVPTSLSLGGGWRVEWTLGVGGVPTTYRNNAFLVRSRLAPMITDADLFRRVSGLNPASSAPLSSVANYQPYIDEAFVTLHGWLTGRGSLPHLVMEPSALRETLMLLTLTGIFEDFATRLTEGFAIQAAEYRRQYMAERAGLSFEYDLADTGRSDGRRKRSASPTVWLGGWG